MAWTKVIPAHPVVAVAGATGAVGNEFLKVLHDLNFPASEVRALASARSAGKKLPFEGCGDVPAGELTVQEMTSESFEASTSRCSLWAPMFPRRCARPWLPRVPL